jgi:hypothetical protein
MLSRDGGCEAAVARGRLRMSDTRPRPEQVFFDDPAVDRLMGVVMALAGEVYVLRDRLRCLEAVLAAQGTFAEGTLDRCESTPEQAQADAADRDAFVAHLMDNLLGRQAARGPL